MVVNGSLDSLRAAFAYALKQRELGHTHVVFDLEPQRQMSHQVYLWEGIIGCVVGRVFHEDSPDDFNPDMPTGRTVAYVAVRVNITDVIEAGRRANMRDDDRLAKPLRANRVLAPPPPSTTR